MGCDQERILSEKSEGMECRRDEEREEAALVGDWCVWRG